MNAPRSGGVCEESRSTRNPLGRNRMRDFDQATAHELRNRLATALLAVEVMKSGHPSTLERSIATLERSLRELREMIERPDQGNGGK